MNLSNAQIDDLAQAIIRIAEQFYKDSKNEGDFQEWMRSKEDKKSD